MWTLKQLYEHDVKANINNKWVPARPIPDTSLKRKLRDAYKVFIGKAEAFTWPEGQ